MIKKISAASFVWGVTILLQIATVSAGQKVILGRNVAVDQQISMDQIDHSQWDQLLRKYVNDLGRVDYRAWKASATDGLALDQYLDTLSTASRITPANQRSKLAFWINAYNAVTVKGILREYPTTSIRNHTARLIGYNIWKDLLLVVGNSQISLNDIEHEVLRKMGEPRIHFAIVCASVSCPRLLNQAYTAQNLAELLDANSKAFFADRENFQFDAAQNQFRLSSILSWFKEDFGSNQADQLKTIAPYLPTAAAHQAAMNNSVKISYLKYDWSLNDQK